ncbi:hypothetical protein CZ771_09195 [Actinomycetales bacterium JB111]|nr:hypothetical protein CZ771_09195 [Actinomycetales bacterium JB111]
MTLKDQILDQGGIVLEDIETLREKLQEAQNACHWMFRYLIDPTIDPVYSQLDTLIGYIEELIERLGDSEKIRQLALDWKTWGEENETNAQDISPVGTSLPALLSWEENGTVYKAVAGQQHEAVSIALPEIAFAIQEELDDAAQALDDYWRHGFEFAALVAGSVAGLIGSIAGVIASCIALIPPATPGGIAGLVASIGGFGASVAGLAAIPGKWDDVMTALDGVTTVPLENFNAMPGELIGNHPKLDSGTWPPHFVVA